MGCVIVSVVSSGVSEDQSIDSSFECCSASATRLEIDTPFERYEKFGLLVVSHTNTRSSSDTLYKPFTPPNQDLLAFTRCFAFDPLWPRQTFHVYSKALSSVRSIITIDQAESLEAFSCGWLE